jgi:DNA-binding FadR family transcriptional regulator
MSNRKQELAEARRRGPALSSHEEQGSRVAGELIALIQQRRYEPGERLPSERDLAERFSVGRGVVREALSTLEAMRYLERRPNSGVFLCRQPTATSVEALVLFADLGLPLDRDTIQQCIEVRRLIEVQAIALACSRRTDDDLSLLEENLSASEEARGSEYAEYDNDFHLSILRATHNGVLVRAVTPFYIMSRARRSAFFADGAQSLVSQQHHRAMAEAIAKRDTERATAVMSSHIGRVEEYWLRVEQNDPA